jgi:tetratricopeptide (TPR) repeat protein
MADDPKLPMDGSPEEVATLTLKAATQMALPVEPGRRLPVSIGRYKVISLIGEGGMGSVYEAEQAQPRRRVALKVIRPGHATAEHLRRFQRESEALARLQHPGIAQIYEAGTADAGSGEQPYFAMEFIAQGQRLTTYADARHLDVRQRLELIAQVCDAVHHAHQRGLIHRDLKPGNILVDERGQPKVLDFGVARVTDSDAQATRQTDIGQLVGTLAYMSPEQALADPLDLDVRSDVYALGVILYELLAGQLPYRLSPKLHEAVATIREQDPASLSSVNRVYRGDIETIAGKALEKDKARRYASAAELAADIRRHLEDEPIVARPTSLSYQLHKFARRHTALVAGVAAVALVLVLGLVASTLEAVRAKRAEQVALLERDHATSARKQATDERDRANTELNRAVAAEAQAIISETKAVAERNKAVIAQRQADNEAATSRAISGFLQNDLLVQAASGAQAAPGKPPDPDLKVRTALDRAAARIAGKFEGMPLVEASLRSTLGETYFDLGLYAEAEKQLTHAADLRRRILGPDHAETLDVLYLLGLTYQNLGRHAEAEGPLLHVLEVNRRRWGASHVKTLRSLNALAAAYMRSGTKDKMQQAQLLLIEAAATATRTLGEQDATFEILNNLGTTYFNQGNYARAGEVAAKVLEGQRRVLGEEHPKTLVSMRNVTAVEQMLGHLAHAESLLDELIAIQRRALGAEHPDTLTSVHELANLYERQGKYAQMESILRPLLETRRRLFGPEHPATLSEMNQLGLSLLRQGKYTEAEPFLKQALEERRRILGNKSRDTLTSLYEMGLLRLYQGEPRDAEPILEEVLQVSRETLGLEHPNTITYGESLATAYSALGKHDQAVKVYSDMLGIRSRVSGRESLDAAGTMTALARELNLRQDFAESEPLLREALAIREKGAPQSWGRFNSLSLLGVSLAGQRKFSDGERLLQEGVQGLLDRRREIPLQNQHFLDSAGQALVRLYQDLGESEKALEWERKLLSGSAAR